MKRIFIHGAGVVSPAGWGWEGLRAALAANTPVETSPLPRPGWSQPLQVRKVSARATRLEFLSHPRLRRASAVTNYAAAAAHEALAGGVPKRLGILFCVTGACVQFSRRFYDETWSNPATASPLVFPETVFNAPSSHLGALLESTDVNYTLVGDAGTFLQALGTAADWLQSGRVEACLVAGAEELDWITADACRHFSRGVICSEGAGALLLSGQAPSAGHGVELIAITDSHLYLNGRSRMKTIQKMRDTLPRELPGGLLCDSQLGLPASDRAEAAVWQDWPGARLSPRSILGEGLMATGAWQCVTAVNLLREKQYPSALVSICGGHQQAIGAWFASV
ncbi:MAG TPA: hypothetical protein VFC44_04840 [Candidatus Saccharimonadales bacterium]|nr:hypothetical protein [Candidatus Saccharimonadales bacterium]